MNVAPCIRIEDGVGETDTHHLDLAFVRSPRGRTELVARRVAYPWSLTQPFHDDTADGMATVIPQSASGGLYADERVRQRISVADGAALHVSTQGATLAHKCPGSAAIHSDWHLDVGAEGRLEVLNDPIVLGPEVDLHQSWDLTVDPSARLLLVDSWTWLEADGSPLFRRFRNDIAIRDSAGRLLARERSDIPVAALDRQRQASGQPLRAFATAVVAGQPHGTALVGALRTAVDAVPGAWSGVATLPNGAGIVVRGVLGHAGGLLPWTEAVWRAVRIHDCGAPPATRRRGL